MDINGRKLRVLASNIHLNDKIRAVVYVICCAVLLYQVTISCIDYYSFKTVVQIKIAKSDKMEIPAISVCKQIKISQYLELLKTNDPKFAKKLSLLMSSRKSEEFAESSAEAEASAETLALEAISLFFDNENKDANSFFNIIKGILDVNCTDVQSHAPVDCTLRAERINSFTQRRVCVTFFSKLFVNYLKNDSNFSITENFTQKLDFHESMFAWIRINNPSDDVFIYLHTSQSMPDISLNDLEMTKSRVFKNKTYGIIYYKYFVNRLEPPYITECYNYTRNRRDPEDPLSEFGCIERCKKRYWKNKTHDKCLPIDLVFVMESNDSKEKICNCTVKPCDISLNKCQKCEEAESPEYKLWTINCENNCRQDCYEEYYQKDMFELKYDYEVVMWKKFNIDADRVNINTTIIFLAAKYLEEISYTHVPKMSQFEFFAALGGLFSLWIGASVLTIYDVIQGLFKIGIDVRKRALENKLLFWRIKNMTNEELRNPNHRVEWIVRNSFRPRADLTKYKFKY